MITAVLVCLVAMLGAGMAKKADGTLSMVITLGACVYLLIVSVSKLSGILGTMYGIFSALAVDSVYYAILLKITGIAYVGELGTALCKDAGYHALGEQVAMVAKLSILAISMPVLLQLVEVIMQFA